MMLTPEILERLRAVTISRRDRRLIYATLALAWLCIGAILSFGADTELFRIALNGCFWLVGALVFLFVAGAAHARRIAADAAKPAEPQR